MPSGSAVLLLFLKPAHTLLMALGPFPVVWSEIGRVKQKLQILRPPTAPHYEAITSASEGALQRLLNGQLSGQEPSDPQNSTTLQRLGRTRAQPTQLDLQPQEAGRPQQLKSGAIQIPVVLAFWLRHDL